MEFLNLPSRTTENRTYGLTSIADFGVPIGELKHFLEDYSCYIDIAKLGVGSAYVTPNLKEKVALYKSYNIKPYFGGTLFEKCFLQEKMEDYIAFLKDFDIEWIEVSTGTLDIPLEERIRLVSQLKADFHVLGEVGSKDGDAHMTLTEWVNEMNALLQAGCEYVITEGRDSGTSGIYNKDGAVKTDLILEVIKNVNEKKVIFEAPTAKHQMFFINQLGANVNLGNVRLHDTLLLEAQRKGLRNETFYLEEQHNAVLFN